MNKKVIITGSFDPFTLGHLDLAKRAHRIFGNCTAVMLKNDEKDCMFDKDVRVALARASLVGTSIEFDSFDGFVADYCKKNNVGLIIRGIREGKEYEYEKAMAHANAKLCGVETLFMPARYKITSSIVREAILTKKPLENLLAKGALDVVKLD
jgi:pantetheine-phosphate adenylyltransferase